MKSAANRYSLRALLPLSVATGCVEDGKPPEEAPSRTVASWELPLDRLPEGTALWPKGPNAPAVKKRRVSDEPGDGRLVVRVDGADPWLLWRFESPVHAAVFRIDVESDAPGPLQLFWSTLECPAFAERCSATQPIPPGRIVVAFLLDERQPIRELRLDLPDRPGARLSFGSISVQRRGILDSPWTGREGHSVAEVTAEGLRLVASGPDPWMVVATPGLDAARVAGIDLEVHGLPGPPQLYWEGPCGNFNEACSVVLTPADAGSTTHHANLRASPKWTGRIGALRLDPGPGPGTYWIDRVELTRAEAK